MTRAVALLLLLVGPMGCNDPGHDDDVKSLGDETPGVPPGPLHRPGQPCLTCHGGDGPADSEFSVAGTVYLLQSQGVPVENAVVTMEDVNGIAGNAVTNAAGSFWVNADTWRPTYPMQVHVKYLNVTARMNGTIGRAGSCANCHQNSAAQYSTSQTSSGRIYIARSQSQIQGAMPPQ
jgi:hypothetical protein